MLRKYSSCSTIFIDDSTVSQPNLKNTIKAVAFAIYFHIRNRESNRTLEIFDEKLHPLSVSHQNINFRMIQNIPKSITIMIPVCKLWGVRGIRKDLTVTG